MQRRTFLKLVGIGVVGLSLTNPLELFKLIETNNEYEAIVRELIDIDIRTLIKVVRYDIATIDKMYHVAFYLGDNENLLEEHRKKALKVLFEKAKEEGIQLKDLIKLEIPNFYRGQYIKHKVSW